MLKICTHSNIIMNHVIIILPSTLVIEILLLANIDLIFGSVYKQLTSVSGSIFLVTMVYYSGVSRILNRGVLISSHNYLLSHHACMANDVAT